MDTSLVKYLTETASELVEKAQSAPKAVACEMLLEASELNYLAARVASKVPAETQTKLAA